MQEADFDRVCAIERASFPVPWSRPHFARELILPVSRFVVAVADDTVLGYAGCWVVAGEAQILTLAVRQADRRRGVARSLLERLLELSRAGGAAAAYLEVRASNAAARLLYEQKGFAVVARRRRYYAPDNEDACVMAARLDSGNGDSPPGGTTVGTVPIS